MIDQETPPSLIRLAQAGRGYIEPPQRYHERFRKHSEVEERIRHTATGQAEQFADCLESLAIDLQEYLSDGQRDRAFTFVQLGRAIDPDLADTARDAAMRVLAIVGEFKHSLPRGAR